MDYLTNAFDKVKQAASDVSQAVSVENLKGDECCLCPPKDIESYMDLMGQKTTHSMAAVGMADSLLKCVYCSKVFCPKHAKAGIKRRKNDVYSIPKEFYAKSSSSSASKSGGILESITSTAHNVKAAMVGESIKFACDEPNPAFEGSTCRSYLIKYWMGLFSNSMRNQLRLDQLMQFLAVSSNPNGAMSKTTGASSADIGKKTVGEAAWQLLDYERPMEREDNQTMRSMLTTIYVMETGAMFVPYGEYIKNAALGVKMLGATELVLKSLHIEGAMVDVIYAIQGPLLRAVSTSSKVGSALTTSDSTGKGASSSSSSSSVAVQAIAVEAAGPDVDAASISSSGATNDLKKLPDDTSPSSSSSSSSIAKVAAFTNATSAASASASATSDEVLLDPVLAEKKRSLYQRTTGSIATRYQEYKLLIGSIYYLHCKHDLEAMSLSSSSGLLLPPLPVHDNASSLSQQQHTPAELRELALINEEERQCSAELLDLVGTYVGAASWLYFTKMPGAYSTDDWTAWFLHRVVRKCDNVALEEEQLVLNTNGAAAATAAGGERRDQGANKKSPTLSAADEHGWVLVGVSCESKQAPAFSRIKEEILVRRTREENSEQAAAATAGASKQPPPPPKPQQQQQQQRQDQNGGGASSNDNEEAQKEIRYHDQLTIVPAFALFLREPSPHHHEKEVLLVIRGTKSLADCLVDISDDPTEFVYLQGEATSRPVTPAQSPQMQQNTKHTTNHLQQQPLSQAAAAAAAAPSKPPKPTVASAATAGATTGSGDAGATGSSSGVGATGSVGIETVTGKAHGGMLRGAECMLDSCGVGEAMDLLVEHGYHKITIVGHSLGGGTAALVAMMLKTRYAQKYVLMPSTCPTAAMQISASMPSILAVTYGTPAVVSPTLADAVNEDKLVISVVNKSDLVPRISMANIFALADEVVAYRPQAEQHMSRDYEEYRERFVTGGRTRNRKTTAAAAAAADTPQPMPNERVPAATATATVPTAVPLNNNNNTTIGAPPRDTFDFATVHSIIPETNVTSRTNANDEDDDVHGDNSNSSSNNRQSHQLGSGRGANGAGEAQMQAAVQESVNNEIGGVLSSLEAMPDASLARLVVPGRIVDLHPDLQGSGRMTATVYDYSSHPSLSSIKMTSSCLDDHKIENYLYSLRNMRLSREMQGDARLKPRYKRRPVWEPALHARRAGREGRGSGALLSEIALSSGLEAAACWRQCNVCGDDCTTVFTTSGISARAHSMVNCRACGRIVCLACAPAGDEIPAEGISQKQKLRDFRIPLPSLGLIEPQRVCMPCYYNSYFI